MVAIEHKKTAMVCTHGTAKGLGRKRELVRVALGTFVYFCSCIYLVTALPVFCFGIAQPALLESLRT